jgi:hypothetical protein
MNGDRSGSRRRADDRGTRPVKPPDSARPVDGARVVMSEYKGWTIRVTPSGSAVSNRWHARVEVWPPIRYAANDAAIIVNFAEWRRDENAIARAAIAAVCRYVDGSGLDHA